MKVSDIHSVKLIKRGDNLTGSMSCCRNYVAKHSDVILYVVLPAGTNDLSNKNYCPEDLIKDLANALTDPTHFSNVQQVFICKIPPHLDFHNINNKVSEFNSLLSERFSDTEEHISVVDTIFLNFVIIMSKVFTLVILVSRKFVALFYPICIKFLLLPSIGNVRVPALLMLKVVDDAT